MMDWVVGAWSPILEHSHLSHFKRIREKRIAALPQQEPWEISGVESLSLLEVLTSVCRVATSVCLVWHKYEAVTTDARWPVLSLLVCRYDLFREIEVSSDLI